MTNRLLRVFLLSLAAVAVCAPSAWAATVSWNVASGDVSLGSNWDTLTVPTTGDVVVIGNNGTATISDGNTFAGTIGDFNLGTLDGLYGKVIQTGGAVSVNGWMRVGHLDNLSGVTSQYDLQGGSLTVSSLVVIGLGTGASGELLMSGGTAGAPTTLTTNNRIHIGDTDGVGNVEMRGYSSLTSTANTVYVGSGSNTVEGTLKMFDNAILSLAVSTADSRIGYTAGKGTMEMSGNTSATVGSRRLDIGNGAGAMGTLKMSGNSVMSVTNNNNNDTNYQFLVGNGGGTGSVELNDNASLTVNSTRIYIGGSAGSAGTMTMTGSSQMKFNTTNWFRVGSNGTGTINLSGGDATTPGAKLTAAGGVNFGLFAGTGTLNVSEYAEFVAGGVLTMGDNSGTTGTGTGNLNVLGHGKVSVNGLNIGAYARGVGNVVLTDNAVVTSTAAVHVGYWGTGTMTLGGGSLLSATTVRSSTHATYGTGTGTLYFDGGTLQARANHNDFVVHNGGNLSTIIKSGGAIFDSSGYDIVVKTDLLADATSPGGGLTKNGAGQLVLASGLNTYTGATAVNAGTLVAHNESAGSFGAMTVSAGACLTSAKWDSTNNVIFTDNSIEEAEADLKTSSLTFDDGAKLGVVLLDDGGDNLAGANTITTNALAPSATSALVEVVLPTTAPAGTGSYAIVNYASNSGVTFLPKVDGIGTKGVTIADDTMETVSITLSDMNQWIPGGANPNYSVGGNWTASVAPNGTDQRALFTGTGETVTLDMNATLSSLNFEGDGGYNIIASGANKFTMDSSVAMNAHIQNVSGSNTIAAPIVLNKNTQITVAQAADTLTLSGAVTGAGDIEKVGAGTLAMADLGSGPAGDLVLGGGTFRYTGATATTNRGLSTTGAATIDVAGSDATLTLTGSVTTTGGGALTKVGAGTIEFAGPAGTHALTTGQLNVNGGSLAFGGTNGATYDINNARTYVGVGGTTGTMELSGDATVTNTNSVHSYVGQGTGSVGTLSLTDQAQMVVTNTNADTWAGQLWVGSSAGATGTINLSGGTSTENPGAKLIVTGMSDIGSYGPSGETPAGKGYLNVHDYAQFETRGLVMGDGGEGYLLIDGNGKVTSTGNQWMRFGFFNTGIFSGELKDNATLHATGEMRLGDNLGSGELTLTSPGEGYTGATLRVDGHLYVGRNGLAAVVDPPAAADPSNGTLNVNAGTSVIVGGGVYVGMEDNAIGVVNMTGGSITTGGWFCLVRGGPDSTGTLNMSGDSTVSAGTRFFVGNGYSGTGGTGTANLSGNAQISSGADICIAWGGVGVLNVGDGEEPAEGDTGAVARAGTYVRLADGNTGNADATLNLNVGGTVETPYIDSFSGTSAKVNFNGGTLRALENTTANAFIGNTGTVASFALNVKAGGAKIDSNGFDVVINPDLVEDAGSTGGGLTKLGEGNLTLGGANTYTGDTRIEGGSLTTFAPLLNDFADVWISNGALFDLEFLGTDTIGALFLGGVSQALGTYGSSLSGATYQLDDYFSGTGMLLVTELTFVQIPGDADGDMKVDAVDAKRLAENWGATSLNPSYTTMWEMGDFNGDGKIDAKDASILAAHWGDHNPAASESQGTAVPEPGIFALLLGLALAGLARRVRR